MRPTIFFSFSSLPFCCFYPCIGRRLKRYAMVLMPYWSNKDAYYSVLLLSLPFASLVYVCMPSIILCEVAIEHVMRSRARSCPSGKCACIAFWSKLNVVSLNVWFASFSFYSTMFHFVCSLCTMTETFQNGFVEKFCANDIMLLDFGCVVCLLGERWWKRKNEPFCTQTHIAVAATGKY